MPPPYHAHAFGTQRPVRKKKILGTKIFNP